MKKLCQLLALVPLLLLAASGCSPKDATQTVVEVWPDMPMRELVQTIKVQAYGLPNEQLATDEPEMPVMWPVRRTFTPSSKSSSHRFRMVLTAFDATKTPVANFTLEADLVEQASHYVQVRLSDSCRPTACDSGVCYALIDNGDLGKTRQEASCAPRNAEPDSSGTAADGDMTVTGSGSPSGMSGPMSMLSASTGTAANGGTSTASSGQVGQVDAGMMAPLTPPSTEAECHDNPCGPNGDCRLSSAVPSKYVCTCHVGYELNDSATTCVVRNDCNKNNGGCDGPCETVMGTGEAKCSCQGDTWLKGDGQHCARLKPEQQLSIGNGSVQRTRPQVAFDSAGNGVVAWTETSDDGKHTMWSARYSADTKAWEKPMQPFVVGSTNAADLHLALDANGSGLLIWTATVNSHRQLWAARYSNHAFAPFSASRIDAGSDNDALMPAFALDSAGDGLLAWTDAVYPNSSLRVSRYSASSSEFTPMPPLLDMTMGSLVVNTSVALHNAQSGFIAWTNVPVSMPDGSVSVELDKSAAFHAKVGGADLGQIIGFETGLAPSTSPDVAMDASGRGVAVWLRARADGATDSYTLLTSVYVSGSGWASTTPQTLENDVSLLSSPHIAVGADGSSFAVWRKIMGSGSSAQSLTRGALSSGNGFENAQDLGLLSDVVAWSEGDGMTWTPETIVHVNDQWQPHWDLAAGPNQTGFVVGAAYTSGTPVQRELWLQRVASEQEPTRPIRITDVDSVPAQPSPPKIGMNANGDGALVWDRQRDGHYFVYVSALQ